MAKHKSMNKYLKQYQETLDRIDQGLAKNTLAIEDIESLFESMGGYIETLERKIARLEKTSAKGKNNKSSSRKVKSKINKKTKR
jgi:predicted  nucleic acid-binding Zn-ribbon protein